MRLTEEAGTPYAGKYCVSHIAGGHIFGKLEEAGSPFSWATGDKMGSYCSSFRSYQSHLYLVCFPSPHSIIGLIFNSLYFFFLIFSSLTISLWPASSLYVSKSGFFTFQKMSDLINLGLYRYVFWLTLLWFPALLQYVLASFGFGVDALGRSSGCRPWGGWTAAPATGLI